MPNVVVSGLFMQLKNLKEKGNLKLCYFGQSHCLLTIQDNKNQTLNKNNLDWGLEENI